MCEIKPFKNQDYESLKRQHNRKNLFKDPIFPPNSKSLSHTNVKKLTDLKWRRSTELCSAKNPKQKLNPQFVVKNYHRGDLDQGILSDCWFIAAASAVTLHQDLLARVIPSGQSFNGNNYAGIFHFRFWINGEWRDVVVDDYLPCDNQGRLVFCRNKYDENEMWSSLLEKAYAKVCGTYEAMMLGYAEEGLIDMTGGIGESFSRKDEDDELFKNPDKMKHYLIQAYNRKSMIGCSAHAKGGIRDTHGGPESRLSNGLVTGHQYSITKLAEVNTRSGRVLLIRCLNPWGSAVEWKGQFSDNDRFWNENKNEKNRLNFQKREDGEFWMTFEDFFQNFDALSVCHRGASGLCANEKSEWFEKVFHGQWENGKTDIGYDKNNREKFYQNPQYFIRINSKGRSQDTFTVIISLMVKDARRRRLNNLKKLSIIFALFKINSDVSIPRTIQQGKLKFEKYELTKTDNKWLSSWNRELVRQFDVPNGDYIIIPSTMEAKMEARFLLRVFIAKKPNGNETIRNCGNSVAAATNACGETYYQFNDSDDNDLESRDASQNDSDDEYPDPNYDFPDGYDDNDAAQYDSSSDDEYPEPNNDFPDGYDDSRDDYNVYNSNQDFRFSNDQHSYETDHNHVVHRAYCVNAESNNDSYAVHHAYCVNPESNNDSYVVHRAYCVNPESNNDNYAVHRAYCVNPESNNDSYVIHRAYCVNPDSNDES